MAAAAASKMLTGRRRRAIPRRMASRSIASPSRAMKSASRLARRPSSLAPDSKDVAAAICAAGRTRVMRCARAATLRTHYQIGRRNGQVSPPAAFSRGGCLFLWQRRQVPNSLPSVGGLEAGETPPGVVLLAGCTRTSVDSSQRRNWGRAPRSQAGRAA